MTTPPRATPAHIASLDLLRLAAALAVVAFHYLFRGAAADGYLAEGYPQAAPYAIYGYLGVNLFFLISGFVIAWSAEGKSWQSFAISRFARLYPGFLICMTITFLVVQFSGSAIFPVSWAQYAANLVMFSPAFGQPFIDGAYWSIILEIIFYGWVAIALFAGLFDRFRLELVAGWLMVSALNEFVAGSEGLRLLFVTEFAPLFAAGILVHHIHLKGRSQEALMLLIAAFLLSSATMMSGRAWMLEQYGMAVPLAGLLASNVAIHALLFLAVRFRDLVRASPLVLAIGGITYPLYLLHQHIGYVVIGALAPLAGKWFAAGIALGAVLAGSFLVWRFFEMPARKTIVGSLAPLAVSARWPHHLRGFSRTSA